MDLIHHYRELYKSSIEKMENGAHRTDALIDSPDDNRFGITLLIRPPQKVNNRIQLFLEELKQIDPSQYYYPNSDIHITVLSIISCYEGFRLDQISVSEYLHLIEQGLKGIQSFEINFRGITASDSGIMIQGFPENEMLNQIRYNLRKAFKNSDLKQSLDQRYVLKTAHGTTVRFKEELQNKTAFLERLEDYSNFDFGNFEVNELELVFNDWYHREKNLKPLKKFGLLSSPLP